MQWFIAAMLSIRQAFYAALVKSLLRTKSFVQTILNLWISPTVIKGENVNPVVAGKWKKGISDFLKDVEKEFGCSTTRSRLVALSADLKTQFESSLKENQLCMLPSYNHLLPTGDECGTYLGLDVGGSTFRVALIELCGRRTQGEEIKIIKRTSFKINNSVRQLKGVLFFDWMAERIVETLSEQTEGRETSHPLSMGLSWSFPVEQTSLRSGLLQGMGKNFQAAHGLVGQDLGKLIQDACSRKCLNVEVNAIVNDSSATLLSRAYLDPTTRFALILGTGVNAAVHLPVHMFSPAKLGVRPSSWHDRAEHVIVNTELSMFGAGILPFTRWDKTLLITHPRPDFQPLEHFVGGGYLGEIARLVLVDGIQTAGLFGGVVPISLREPYSLDTETLSRMESDLSPTLSTGSHIFTSSHPSTTPPTLADLQALRLIASLVSRRACGVIASGVHGLWQLRKEAKSIAASESSQTFVAYNGSVLENYPNFRSTCQKHLDTLVEASGEKKGVIELIYAEESSLLGAAVAVACLDG